MVVVPARMGRLNRRALLQRLQRLGTATRAELAKSLGLSQPTTGKIVGDLLELGILQEIDVAELASERSTSTRLGRPGRALGLHRAQPRFIGIHVGISETGLAPLTLWVGQDEEWPIRFPTPASAEAWRAQLADAAPRLGSSGWWGVLISLPGIVEEPIARVVFSPNLHWTEQADLKALIQRVWPVPVVVVQEERALAHGHHATVPGADDFLLVDFGEGVGGAAIIGGQPFTTSLPLSGELGHVPVLGNQRRCGCGAIGCVETLVSYRGLLDSFAAAEPGQPPTWAAMSASLASPRALPLWLQHSLDATAAVIAGALNVLGLRHVVITGSLTDLPPTVVNHLALGITRGAMWARFGEVTVTPAPRRRAAGLVAAGIDRIVVAMNK